jgi:hypothetical protein
MSNAVAVAAVTETMGRIVEAAAKEAVTGANLSTARPQAPPSADPTQVNLFLYRVTENPALRADDLPSRKPSGVVLQKPQIALDLHYLISFFGRADHLEPERMLGRVMSRLHSQPLLSPEAIQSVIDSSVAADPAHFLGEADLPRQVAGVRLTPTDLDIEELSKLWSVFFQEPYALSVAYQVAVVLIEADAQPLEGLPVETRQVKAVPVAAPHITTVEPMSITYSAAGSTITLRGRSLASEHVVARFGDLSTPPGFVTNQRIDVVIPQLLPAGIRTVDVAHMVEWGTADAPDPRPIIESNRVAFAYQPIIEGPPASVARPGPLILTLAPRPQAGQEVRLMLREAHPAPGVPPTSFEVSVAVEVPSGPTVAFDLTGAQPVTYLMRVAVDDAASPLESDPTGFTGPMLVVTP